MLRVWGRRATRDLGSGRALGGAMYSALQPPSQDAVQAAGLRVGVLGLGAIGTILFTRLGLLAASGKTEELQVDAFVKPQQFDAWAGKERPQLSLQGQGHEVLAFQRSPNDKVATALNAPSVRVRTLETAEDDGDDALDVLLVATKAYDSAGVIRELRARNKHLLKDDALCVLLQNGLGQVPEEEGLSSAQDRWQFANGVTFVGGRVQEFGSVLTSGLDAGVTYLAPCAGSDVVSSRQKMKSLAQVFRAARINCEVLRAGEMQAMLWRKLIVNAAINPVASLLDASNNSVASSAGSRHCVDMVVQEALAVAKCEKIPLTCSHDELVADILEVARNTGTNVCSMLADLRRGSRTEIDAITGRIVAGGKRHGIPTPTNELLLSLIQALEQDGTRRVR